MAILKLQFACNYSVNLNFDTRYLGNARSDLHEVFFYLFVFWSSFIYIRTENLMFTPPSGLNGEQEVALVGEFEDGRLLIKKRSINIV